MAELDKAIDSTGAISKEDAITFMAEDSDDKETISLEDEKDKKEDTKKEAKKPKVESKESDESEDDELEESEVELESEKPDGKSLELLTPVAKTEVLKKYPDLFKDFPELETTCNREQAFTERFATIKDADNALRDSETLEKFEEDLINGKTENMLMAAKQADPNAFKMIVDNYLTTLGQVDEKAYYHVIGNTIKYTIASMLQEAKSSSDEKLQEAAQILNYFIFGTSKIEPPTNLAEPKGKDTDSDKLAKEKKEFANTRLNTVTEELYTKINKSIKNTVDTNIDPQNKLREYDKRNATRDVLEELESVLTKDIRFGTIMDRLWKDAAKTNYNKESVDKIKSLFFSRAKALLPAIIKKARSEAISGKKAGPKSESKVEDKIEVKKEKPESSRSSIPNNKKQVIPKGMSTLEFLNSGE